MGGAVGHLMHLYDDFELTFKEIKEIFHLAANAKLDNVTEKLDGRNIVFTFDVSKNELLVARSIGDMSGQGLRRKDLDTKFGGNASVSAVFKTAFDIIELALTAIGESQKLEIFGYGKFWYSAEIISSEFPNVVRYDSNAVILHGYPLFYLDDLKKVEKIDDLTRFNIMMSFLETMNKKLKPSGWNIKSPVVVQMSKISDSEVLNDITSEIDSLMSFHGMKNSDSIQSFIEKTLTDELRSRGFSGSLLKSVHARILHKPGAQDLRSLKAPFRKSSPRTIELLDSTIKSEERIISSLKAPLDKIVGRFASIILSNVKSQMIDDNDKEIKRLREELQKQISLIKSNNISQEINFLEKHLGRMGSVENVTSAVEGIVFSYKNRAYKFTGNFAPANQILGLYKYK